MNMNFEYERYLRHIMEHGTPKTDRTGTGTLSVFGYQMRFNLAEGFPLITTKKVHFKSIAIELLWFLKGMTNVRWLKERGVTIWNEWADESGDLGPVYGAQWRSWPGIPEFVTTCSTVPGDTVAGDEPGVRWDIHQPPIDQIAEAVKQIKTNPDSRRIIVSAWNVADIPKMALAPCHAFFQFYVADGKLSCQLYQRSCDSFLGVPFNIASYALLTHLVADQCGLEVGDFVWTGGDCHIYNNHFEQVKLQLTRDVMPFPRLKILRRPASIDGYEFEDFEIVGYEHHAAIKAPVAV